MTVGLWATMLDRQQLVVWSADCGKRLRRLARNRQHRIPFYVVGWLISDDVGWLLWSTILLGEIVGWPHLILSKSSVGQNFHEEARCDRLIQSIKLPNYCTIGHSVEQGAGLPIHERYLAIAKTCLLFVEDVTVSALEIQRRATAERASLETKQTKAPTSQKVANASRFQQPKRRRIGYRIGRECNSAPIFLAQVFNQLITHRKTSFLESTSGSTCRLRDGFDRSLLFEFSCIRFASTASKSALRSSPV